MSDRTYAQVTVYDCPDDQRPACLAAILEAFDVDDPGALNEHPTIDTRPGEAGYDPNRYIDADALVLGERYGAEECAGDLSDAIASAIIDAAPGATFATWTDPAYDWLGALVMYAPGLGRFYADCDASGNAVVPSSEVSRMMAESLEPDERRYGGRWPDAALRDALRDAFGIDWDDAIKAARARIDAEPVPTCDYCGRPEDQDPTNGREYDWNGETGCHASCESAIA